MHTQKLIPLVDPEVLEDLIKNLRKMATNHARVFEAETVNKKSHCDAKTSVGRILSTREVCACIVLKDKRSFVATNLEAKGGLFREEVGQLMSQLVKNGFKEEDKLALWRRCFIDVIKIHAKPYNDELFQVESFRVNVILKSDWDRISLKEIKALKEEIEAFWDINKKDRLLAMACAQVLTRLCDIDTICNELAAPEYEEFRESLISGQFYKRYNSVNGLHCELAALERDNKTTDLQTLVLQRNKEAKNKRFTISKFCCGACALVFKVLFESLDYHPQTQHSNFHYLGDSCIFYPNWKSPLVIEDEYSKRVAATITHQIKAIIHAIQNASFRIEPPSPIENSKWVEAALKALEVSDIHHPISTPRI